MMTPLLLQPVRYNDADYFRMVEQRRTENNRGASRGCIERNTFPHKFKKVLRYQLEESKDEKDSEEVDKCTICISGKWATSEHLGNT